MRGDEIEKLKAKIVKPVPLDPDSEAARRIDALEKKVKTLVPAEVKTKIAKALTEQTTSLQNRLDALQAWNGLGSTTSGSKINRPYLTLVEHGSWDHSAVSSVISFTFFVT